MAEKVVRHDLEPADRAQAYGVRLRSARSDIGLTPRRLYETIGRTVPLRRIEALEEGTATPTDAELDRLCPPLGLDRVQLQLDVRQELMSRATGGPAAPLVPTIMVNLPMLLAREVPQLAPVTGLLRTHLEHGSADGDVPLTGQAIAVIAERCGMDTLTCWQLLAGFIMTTTH